jgi:hypothetical protein
VSPAKAFAAGVLVGGLAMLAAAYGRIYEAGYDDGRDSS